MSENQRNLPDGWRWVKLGDITTVFRGSSPRPKNDTRYYGGNIPRLLVEDVTRDGMYVTPKIDFLTEDGAKLSRPMNKGDLVMVVSGAPGLPAILAVDACIHDGFAGFKNIDKNILLKEFLFYFFKFIQIRIDSQARGAIFRNLTTDQIRDINIGLPPLSEQKRIAAILKEQIAAVEEARKAALSQLEAAEELPKAYLRAVFESEEALAWERKKLGDISNISTGTTPATNNEEYYKGNIPFVKTNEIINNRIAQSAVYINQQAIKNYLLKIYPIGTVLLAMYGQGKTRGQVGILDIPATTTQNAAAIVPNDVLNSEYLWLWLRGQYNYLRLLGFQGDLSHLSLKYVKELEIPLLPLSEQKRIVAYLSEKLGECDRLKQSLKQQLKAINQLPASFLRCAFNGDG